MSKGDFETHTAALRYYIRELLDSEDRIFTLQEMRDYCELKTGVSCPSSGAYFCALDSLLATNTEYQRVSKGKYKKMEPVGVGQFILNKVKTDSLRYINKATKSIDVLDLKEDDIKALEKVKALKKFLNDL